jgi:riboflavin synthase
MFTGLVTLQGVLTRRETRGPGARLTASVEIGDGPLLGGESIAVDGVCLSVDHVVGGGFEADCSAETLARTTLGALKVGTALHIERALRAGSPIGGHLVTGHVDGVASLVEREPSGEALRMTFRLPPELARFVAEKGSVAVDGVSLTVNTVSDVRFDVMIIPHTLTKTKIGSLSPGDRVNLEVDIVARYVARWMATAV